MKITFLVADEVRQEMGGKQTILGLYADGVIMLDLISQNAKPIGDLPPGIDRLSFSINVSELVGKHRFKGQIINPSGKIYGSEIPLGESDITSAYASRSFIVEAKPFVVSEKGTYHFNLYIDDELHAFPFTIIDRVEQKQAL